MLSLCVYPECLICPWPDFEAIDTGITIDAGRTYSNQFVKCSHSNECKRIKDANAIDFTSYVDGDNKIRG